MLSITVESAEHLRELCDAAAGDPAGRVCVLDLYAGEEPDPDAEHGVEVELLPLLAHPRADRRALVAAEVRVMLRDIAAHTVVANIGGRGGTDGARWQRAYKDVIALMEAGDVGNAHTVAMQALHPTGASASVGVSSVGQVRT